MRMYETLMILHPEIVEERIQAVLGRMEPIIEGGGGKITVIDQWGVRKLAYRIAKQPRGYYVLVKYAADPTIIGELERTLKLTEECLRFITVKLTDEVEAASIAEVTRVHKKPPVTVEEVEEAPVPEESFEEGEEEEGEEEEEIAEKSLSDEEIKEKLVSEGEDKE
jgi:small subunit ribosomal protein S6